MKLPTGKELAAMSIIHIEKLPSYDRKLEEMRQIEFKKFLSASTSQSKRRAFRSFAGLTSRRSPEFIAAYEQAIGIEVAN